jgi:hypothetical protein
MKTTYNSQVIKEELSKHRECIYEPWENQEHLIS